MQTFVDDEAGYLRWLTANPDGFVINAPRAGRGTWMLHTARCPHISNPARTNYTTMSYYKICAPDSTALVCWATDHVAALRPCSACLRDFAGGGRVTAPAGPHRAGAEAGPAGWQLWGPGEVLAVLDGVRPLLESWNSNADPAQIRLQGYLAELGKVFGPVVRTHAGLFLHMDIDIEDPRRLLHHYDLENYLTPVVRHLGARQFVLASATKRVGGGSQLRVGRATPLQAASLADDWAYWGGHTDRGAESKPWQAALRQGLGAQVAVPLPPGPVDVHLAWRCAPGRNWVTFWKPTGDAMGPVLGEPYLHRPFYPNDDRIVALALHRTPVAGMGFAVDVGMWWRPAAGP